MAGTHEHQDGPLREMCWDALLTEVPISIGRMLPTMVALREAPGRTWQVYARVRGREVMGADDLDYDAAADMVMSIFARLMDEAHTAGRRPLPVA